METEFTFTDTTGTRLIRECVICGERVTMSNATAQWESRHVHPEIVKLSQIPS